MVYIHYFMRVDTLLTYYMLIAASSASCATVHVSSTEYPFWSRPGFKTFIFLRPPKT